jgi:hypothetical protein
VQILAIADKYIAEAAVMAAGGGFDIFAANARARFGLEDT